MSIDLLACLILTMSLPVYWSVYWRENETIKKQVNALVIVIEENKISVESRKAQTEKFNLEKRDAQNDDIKAINASQNALADRKYWKNHRQS